MKIIKWTARYLNTPTVVRYCKHCGTKTAFASSGLFRVNAQQKALDIWLIYKCITCDTTWNQSIYSRVNPHSLAPALLHGFHTNDSKLAMQYATDSSLAKRNGAELGIPEVELIGEQPELAEATQIHLLAEWPSEHRAAAAIRSKLGLSRTEFDRYCETGKINCVSGQNLKKCKLSGTIIIEIR